MKISRSYLVTLCVALLFVSLAEAQYGYGRNGYGNGYGRQASRIPQGPAPDTKEEPLTAEELVEKEMPKIVEILGLNEFEKAVVSTTLTKYLKQRMELQLLELGPEKTKEGMRKISEKETADMKAGLPEDKFQAFVELREDGVKKTVKKNKKKKKKKKSKT